MDYQFCPLFPSNNTNMSFLGDLPNSNIAELLTEIRMTTEQPLKFECGNKNITGCSSPSEITETLPDKVPLKEKIGKMLIVGFDGSTAEDDSRIARLIEKEKISGVIIFQRNIEGPIQVKKLTTDLQRLAAKSG